jgi:hypothetical protein
MSSEEIVCVMGKLTEVCRCLDKPEEQVDDS